jgi:hypothetical protein
MLRQLMMVGLTVAALTAPVNADDFFFGGDFEYDDGDWDDGGFQFGGGRRYRAAPYTPGAQNNNSQWDDNWNSPWNPGVQNNNSQWDDWEHNHNHGWNNGWNNNWQYQNQYQYRPQQPQYVAPRVVYSNQPIKISMPEGEPGMCAYVLSSAGQSWNYTMAPGKSQLFNEDRAWTITYDRGNGYGEQTYGLKPGHYRFRQSSRGWELYRSESMDSAPPVPQAPPPPM